MHVCVLIKMESAKEFVIFNSGCVNVDIHSIAIESRKKEYLEKKNRDIQFYVCVNIDIHSIAIKSRKEKFEIYNSMCVLILKYKVLPSNRERKNSRYVTLCVC